MQSACHMVKTPKESLYLGDLNILITLCLLLIVYRGFNKHRQLTKHVSYFAQKSLILFPPKLDAGNKV